MIRWLHKPLALLAALALLLFFLWALAALYFDAGAWFPLALLALAAGAVIVLRSARGTALVVLVGCATVLAWWYTLSPDNNREWRPEVARLPGAQIDGNKITVTNVRNFSYREDEEFDVNWETRSLDLDQLVGVDLFLNFWGPEHIAHTIASWRFADGSHIAVSIETRKESHEEYSATKGFFRQFEIYYVVADERDLIKVRTDHRGEDVYLYRMGFPLEDAKALLLDYMREINRLNQQPRWYNALTHNCTTAIRYHSKHIGAAGPLDWRLFANGHLPELGYERGVLDQSLPLEQLVEASYISDRAKALPADANFSNAIRQGLPGFSR
ncbi:MAG: DUF4105 domain-containing protein [Gammaproteobacteria bacterium]|nr:DUF4105 domain-containing protein [Gammaproteobacteria bacterium]